MAGVVDCLDKHQAAGFQIIGRTGCDHQNFFASVFSLVRAPVQLGNLAGGPVPVLDKRKLNFLHYRTFQLNMGVAPGAEGRVPAQIFIPHVVSAHVGGFAVDYHDFAMVAKIQLKAVGLTFGRVKGRGFDSGHLHIIQIALGQFVAADFIIQKVDLDVFFGLRNQFCLQFAPDVIVFNDEKLLISILAGITTTTFEEGLGGQVRVIRAMPNTPALAGQGAAALCPGKNVSEEDRRVAQHLFETVGIALWVEEGQMDAVTGLSGSGPAFVYTFIEALTAGGVQEGLRLDIAHSLAVQTVVGAAHLVKETGEHPALLREKVCSPAGTTIRAIRVLEERGLRAMMMEAVGAATTRSRELGKEKK